MTNRLSLANGIRFKAIVLALLLLSACSASNNALVVPITAIGSSDDSRVLVTSTVGACADAETQLAIREDTQRIVVTVRFSGSDCQPASDFVDSTVQLDGPLGDRTLVLTQPPGYDEIIGNDVCIIDGEQRSPRCLVEIVTEG